MMCLRRSVAVAATALLMSSGLIWSAPAALAASCATLGGFEIDGNLTAGTCGGTDWNSSGLGVQSTTAIGTYSASSKDDNNPIGWTSAGGTPDKSDFSTVYAFTKVVAGHFDAFVGWERDAGKGTGTYAIEIDNAPVRIAADGTPQPDRSSGGFVVFISFSGSNLPIFNKACAFTSIASVA